ncbi:MAG: hypothetical protein D3908_10965, partial [Candidatus Electrothrix sp. AUS4]|nr:hypothetical protein [Candidatus Electrothrix sp. AUS4]
SSELFLFADDLLPSVQGNQGTLEAQESLGTDIEQGDPVGEAVDPVLGQENSQEDNQAEGAGENVLPWVREESVEDDLSAFSASDDVSFPPLADQGEEEEDESYHALEEKEPVASWDLEEKASVLLREEQDSLVQAVVASMLTRKADEDADPESGEIFDDASLADVDRLDESEECDDIFSSVVAAMLTGNTHGSDEEDSDISGLRSASKDEDTSGLGSDDEGGRGDKASLAPDLNPDASPPSPEAELSDETESSFSAIPALLTEEPDEIVTSFVASMLQRETEAPDAQVWGGEGGGEKDNEEGGSSDFAAAEAVDSEKDTVPVSFSDAGEDEERFIHDQLDAGVSVELFDISVEKKYVEKEARKPAPSLEEGTPASGSNMLQNTYAFPELEEIAEQVAEAEPMAPPFIEQPADFMKKAQFPPLLSPDPRSIKKRLDTLRQKEDEFLFQGGIHEQEDEELPVSVDEKEDWHVNVWKVFFLFVFFGMFLLWFFVFRHDEVPRGKFIEPEP